MHMALVGTVDSVGCRFHARSACPAWRSRVCSRTLLRRAAAVSPDNDSSNDASTSGREDLEEEPGGPRFSLPFNSDAPPSFWAPRDPEAVAAAAAGNLADPAYMEEYQQLKQQLLDNIRKSGGALGLYLLLTVNGEATLWCMLGTAASYGYFLWLCHDVDSVKPTDTVPIWEANRIDNPLLRGVAKALAVYRAALRPRLLVLVGLAALVGVYGKVVGEPLPLVYTGCLLGGFLTYKGALVVRLVDELTPKSFMAQGASRPKVERIEDELDQWGRPKKKLASPIDVMPPEAQQKALQQLAEQQEAVGPSDV